jgi:hypothetical protein
VSIKDKFKRAWKNVVAAVAAAIVAVGAWLGINDAESQTATTDTLSWTAPTQYVNDTPIPAGTITGFRYAWGTTAGGPYPNTQDVGNVLTVNVSRPDPGYGTRCYRVAALVGALNGEWSVERCKTVQAPAKAPSGFAVQ